MKNIFKKKSIQRLFACMLMCAMFMFSAFHSMTISASADNAKAEEKIRVLFEEIEEEKFLELTADPDDYNISVFIELAYSEAELEETSDILSEKDREKAKKHFEKLNKKIAKKLDVDEGVMSEFAPFAEIVYDSLEEYNANEKNIYKIAKNDLVVDIDISLVLTNGSADESASVSSNYDTYYLTDAYDDIGITQNGYYGTGITIGILEEGVPDDNGVFSGIEGVDFVKDRTYATSAKTSHATATTSILRSVGDKKLACNAVFLYAPIDSLDGYQDAFDALIDEGADIINSSVSSAVTDSGVYDNSCAYVDYMIQAYDCLVIKSAGDSSTSDYVTSPGASVNGITVGASTKAGTVAAFSNSGLSSSLTNLVSKPDLLAPGAAIAEIDVYAQPRENGTSFSAALVTGIAVKLMQQYPTLKNNPHLLKTVLRAGCTEVTGQTSVLDPNAGAGIVNYENSQEIMSQGRYMTFTKNSSGVSSEKAVVVGANGTVTFHYTSMLPGSSSNWNTSSATPSFTQYCVSFMNPQKTVTYQTATINKGAGTISFSNNTGKPMVVSLVISVVNNAHSNRTEYFALVPNWTTHTHSYNIGLHASSSTSHTVYCSCGAYKTQSHLYDLSAYICSVCGYDDSTAMHDDHVHEYETYADYDGVRHKLSCECGDYILSNHVYYPAAANCILCPDA